jgi:hypothetical protein
MPGARSQMPPKTPAPLQPDEIDFVKDTIKRFFGSGTVIRNYGPDADAMRIHIETDRDVSIERYDCLGILTTRLNVSHLEVSRKGQRIFGDAKIAYRQGVIL